LDLWDLEVIVVDQVEMLPVFLEGRKMVADVVVFFSCSMPKISDDGDGGFLAFVLVDSLEVSPGFMGGRTMLNVNKWFIRNILSD